MLAKARQEEFLREAEALRGYRVVEDKRLRLLVRLMVQMGLLLIRAGLQLLERYEPAFSQERDTCKTAIGEVTT
jgi:hypothetical protein